MTSAAGRCSTVLDALDDVDLELNHDVFEEVISQGCVPENHLLTALELAVEIQRQDVTRAAQHLSRTWRPDSFLALSLLFEPSANCQVFQMSSDPLLADSAELIEASMSLIDQMRSRASKSMYLMTAGGILTFLLARMANPPAFKTLSLTDRASAFQYKAAQMGLIASMNDLELAESYSREVAANPVLYTVESWMYPTYTRDIRPTVDMSIPSSVLLQGTAREIIRQVPMCNDAYFHLLVTTAIPLVLHHDPTFGLQADDLKASVSGRLEQLPAVPRSASDTVLKQLG